MAKKAIPSIHMEAVEEPKDEKRKLEETGNSQGTCGNVGKHTTRLLESSGKPHTQQSNNKRKTRKGRLLCVSRQLRV